MRVYAYLRVDPKVQADLSTYHNMLEKYGFHIQPHRLIVEEAAVDTPILYRDKIINLINYSLEENNTLIVKGLDSLGSSFYEIYELINTLETKKIVLVCLDYSKNEIKGELKQVFYHFIKMGCEFEMKFKNTKAATVKSKFVKKVGRPEILTAEQQEEVLQKYKKGMSVYALAKEYGVTRTVIQRILKKATEKFKELQLTDD